MLPLKDVVSRFESLGGGAVTQRKNWGCEFGIFQRRAGYVSVSLLSWCAIQPVFLLSALRDKFDGFDDMAYLKMHRTEKGWHATHDIYGTFTAHTGLTSDELSEDQARTKYHRHLVFLRNKLVEDLTSSTKIFVYRVVDSILPAAEVERLANAVHSYGGRPLLYVKADPAPPVGVSRSGDALLLGNIDWFADVDHRTRTNDSGWERMCRGALDLETRPAA